MWSSEDDVVLSAATYYIDTKINKTIPLLSSTTSYRDPPIFQLAEADSYSSNCGKISITINHLLVFHCTFCNNKYGTLFNFLQHITAKHLALNRSEKLEITAEKIDANKKTSIQELEPDQKFLSLDDNSKDTIKKKLSLNKGMKKKPLRVKNRARQNNKKGSEVKYDSKEALIAESESVQEHSLSEVTRGTVVQNKHRSSKRTSKILVENKKSAEQCDKKDAGTAKLKEAIENKSSDVESEEHHQEKISISSLEEIESTMDLKTSDKPPAYKCDKCQKVFAKKISLSTHILIHSNVKNHKCTICETTFTLKSNLTKHLLRHTNVKNFSCDLCDKRFFSSTEVAVHKRIHTGERPYVCFKCGNGFKTTSSLSRHIKRHNNIRTKKCDICEKTFLDSFGLKNHMAGHSSERPFVCSYCSVSFSRKRTLKQHIKLHINAREYKCNICDKSFNQKPALLSHMNHNHKLLEF